MLQALNLARPNDRHFSKRSKGGLRNDGNNYRNRFPQVFYAIGNTHTTAFRFDVNTGILCESVGSEYLPVIAFKPRFESAGQAFKWASTYATSLQAAFSCLFGRLNPSVSRRASQAEADLAVWGKAQVS